MTYAAVCIDILSIIMSLEAKDIATLVLPFLFYLENCLFSSSLNFLTAIFMSRCLR